MQDYVRALVARVHLSILSIGEEERGQGMVEYSLVLVLVAMACVLAFTGLAGKIKDALDGISFSAPTS